MPARLTVILLLVVGALAATDTSEAGGLNVRFRGELECLASGGATLYLSVRNTGTRPLDIKNDFHVTVDRIRAKARKHVALLFVWPASSHDPVPPGEERTFILGIGDGGVDDPNADLRAKEIRIETEFWFENHGHVYRRYMSFPGCRARPAASVRSTLMPGGTW
jgi:hypothetical protein